MSDKLRIGIVGASGWMAGALSVGVEYDEGGFDPESGSGTRNPDAEVAALCDLNREAMEERKKQLGLDAARQYTSYDELLADPDIHAVVIAVPNNLHAQFAVKALEAGKHLFLEKPFATTVDDSRKLSDALRSSDRTTKVDYILVHYDEQENLRALIRDGGLGEVASTLFTYRHPIQVSESAEQVWKLKKEKSGGAIPMGICHAISLTVFQVDAEPKTVLCKSSPPRLRSFDYHTQQDMLIEFENGVVSIVQGNIDFAEAYDARHTIIGTEGQFDYNPYNPVESRVMWSSKSRNRAYGPDATFATHHLDSGDVWKHQCSRTIKEFIDHARKGRKDPLLGLESPLVRRTEAVIWASEASANRGGEPVSTAEFL